MPPQPLSRVKPKADIGLGPGALPPRPQLAAMVSEHIAYWAEIELQRGRFLGALLEANQEAVVAMYLAITSAVARKATIDAAAKAALSATEFGLYSQIAQLANVVEADRNAFAHGLWGYSDDIPDGLLLVDPDYRLRDLLRINELARLMRAGVVHLPLPDIRLDRSHIQVYRDADFRRGIRDAERARQLTFRIANLVALPPGAERDQLLHQLSNEPALRRSPKSNTTMDAGSSP